MPKQPTKEQAIAGALVDTGSLDEFARRGAAAQKDVDELARVEAVEEQVRRGRAAGFIPDEPPRPTSTTPVETLNQWGAGIRGHGDRARIVLVLLRTLAPEGGVPMMSAPQACELAAWLVIMAEGASIEGDWARKTHFDAEQHFLQALEAIRNA